MATKKNNKKTNGQEPTTEQQNPATTVVETAPTPEQPKTNGAEKKPSISAATRELVILNQEKTVEEISAMLIASGWNADDVKSRKSTIATLRTDTLAVIHIAKEKGLLGR